MLGEGTVYAYEFTVDTVNPNATLSYDNNVVKNGKYFNSNRIATIEVDDANFVGTSDMIRITAKNANGDMEAPEITWDGNIGTIEFTEDGIYTLATTEKFKDSANNQGYLGYANGTEAPFEFIIDKTAPVVSVEFSNNNNVNGEYYSQSRKAIINVNDDNFNAVEAMLSVEAKDVNNDSAMAPTPISSHSLIALRIWQETVTHLLRVRQIHMNSLLINLRQSFLKSSIFIPKKVLAEHSRN